MRVDLEVRDIFGVLRQSYPNLDYSHLDGPSDVVDEIFRWSTGHFRNSSIIATIQLRIRAEL